MHAGRDQAAHGAGGAGGGECGLRQVRNLRAGRTTDEHVRHAGAKIGPCQCEGRVACAGAAVGRIRRSADARIEAMGAAVAQFGAWVQRDCAVLSECPALVFQQALNEPETSAPCIAAQSLLRAGSPLVPAAWLRRENKPALRRLVSETRGAGQVTCVAAMSGGAGPSPPRSPTAAATPSRSRAQAAQRQASTPSRRGGGGLAAFASSGASTPGGGGGTGDAGATGAAASLRGVGMVAVGREGGGLHVLQSEGPCAVQKRCCVFMRVFMRVFMCPHVSGGARSVQGSMPPLSKACRPAPRNPPTAQHSQSPPLVPPPPPRRAARAVPTGLALHRALRGHGATVSCLAWAARLGLLASGDEAGHLIVWDTEAASAKAKWVAHEMAVTGERGVRVAMHTFHTCL